MKSLEFKIYKDPNECGNLYKNTKVTINEGLTVLVGCNGSGKTTLLLQILEDCRLNKIPFVHFNNLTDGGSSSSSYLGFIGDFEGMAYNLTSSEGEQIYTDFGRFSSKIAKAIRGDWKKKVFWKDEEEITPITDLVVLIDALDSGLSIDNAIEIKEFIKDIVFKDAENNNVTLYMIAVANAYELARGENCLDLWTGEYITFKDYEDYRKYILSTRKRKDRRINNYTKKMEKLKNR